MMSLERGWRKDIANIRLLDSEHAEGVQSWNIRPMVATMGAMRGLLLRACTTMRDLEVCSCMCV